MHASILTSIGDYARAKCSPTASAALEDLLPHSSIVPFRVHPDVQAMAALALVANADRRPVAAVLESYGRFFVKWAEPVYPAAFDAPDARSLFKGIERVHAIARDVTRGAMPPDIAVEEPSPDRLALVYASPRGLCAIVRGMIRGVADRYREPIAFEETACMCEGAPACRFELRFGPPRGSVTATPRAP
jgi:predicted hydrocarbon binding protein